MYVVVETVAVVESVKVEVTAGGITVLVVVDVMVDVTVEVGVVAVTVRVVEAVLVVVLVVTVCTSWPHITEVGYSCGETVHLPLLSLATICEDAAARAARPSTSRSLILGTYPGSCVIGVKPAGAGTVEVPPATVVVVVAVAVAVCVVVAVIILVVVSMSRVRSGFQCHFGISPHLLW